MSKGKFPGMPNQMNNLMKQVQKMQKEVEKAQDELQSKVYEASAGGGAIKMQMKGSRELVQLEISKDVVDPDDVEMLQDLIMLAFNDLNNQIENDSNALMNKMGGAVPGLF